MITPIALPGCIVERVERDPDGLIVFARAGRDRGRCPACGTPSSAVHSRYVRHPSDLPVFGERTRLLVEVRRFYCHRSACSRRTFAEPLPRFLPRRARRTNRLAEAQARVGAALGGEAGSRLLGQLGMPASGDTVLGLRRRLPVPRRPTPRVLGVDDWAMRKGRTYGTILVDLERRRVVDLLPDRRAATLAHWLQRHRGVRTVARDRSTEYARGIALGAPRARQVADRWHLLLNVRQMAERWLAGAHGRLRRLPPVVPHRAPPARRAGAFPRSHAERASGMAERSRRMALYDEVRHRHAAGEPLLALSRRMGLARGTVRKYAGAESFPERAVRAPGPSRLDPHIAHLEARLAAGCENAVALWRELRGLGYPGTTRQVHRWLSPRRSKPSKYGPRPGGSTEIRGTADGGSTPALPSPRQIAWSLTRPQERLTPEEDAAVQRIQQDPAAAVVSTLVRRFADLVRDRSLGATAPCRAPLTVLRGWLRDARRSGVAAVITFASGLQGDGAAVKAALTTPWSSGQTEGQVNKLKLLKRQTFGRAGFDLLRRRVLLAA